MESKGEGSVAMRRVRLTGSEDVTRRAMRLAQVDVSGWLARLEAGGDCPSATAASARMSGFVAGYLACESDLCDVPDEPAKEGT
jgi:hypothetical protein